MNLVINKDFRQLDATSFSTIKGQGQANVVFNYTGDQESLQHTVLRASKKRSPILSHLTTEEQRHLIDHIETTLWTANPLPSSTVYINQVMAPFISPKYLPYIHQEVPVDDQFIQQLGNLSGLSLSLTHPTTTITLLSDATLLPPPKQQQLQLPTIAIELKPKWGFYSQCSTIQPTHKSIKATTSRYQLLQRYKKTVLKTIAKENKYNPVDLFSLQEDRMRYALLSLFQNPQNNLILFRNGERIERKSGDTAAEGEWEDVMNAFVQGVFPNYNALVDAIIHILLHQEHVLQNIMKAQQMCTMDIEGVYKIYDRLMSSGVREKEEEEETAPQRGLDSTTPSSNNDDNLHDVYSAALKQHIYSLSDTQAMDILRNYLISSTARDCGIIIALQKIPTPDNNNNNNNKSCSLSQTDTDVGILRGVSVNGSMHNGDDIRYRVTVVDLDRKSLEKVSKHYQLDQALMKMCS